MEDSELPNGKLCKHSVVRMIQLIPPTNRCRDLWDTIVLRTLSLDSPALSRLKAKASYKDKKETRKEIYTAADYTC